MPSKNTVVGRISDIGCWVRETRKAKGLTQARLAELAGTGRRFIIELESGKKDSLEVGAVLRVLRRLGLAVAIGPKAETKL